MKLERIVEEIAKTKSKITEFQARLKELERQKIETENTEIVALIRSMDIAPDKLRDFVETCKRQTATPQVLDTTGGIAE